MTTLMAAGRPLAHESDRPVEICRPDCQHRHAIRHLHRYARLVNAARALCCDRSDCTGRTTKRDLIGENSGRGIGRGRDSTHRDNDYPSSRNHLREFVLLTVGGFKLSVMRRDNHGFLRIRRSENLTVCSSLPVYRSVKFDDLNNV